VLRASGPATGVFAEGGAAPWHWTLNPYQGCEMGCRACPARLDQRTTSGWLDFEQRIGVKANLVEAFWHDLQSDAMQSRPIVLGTATDPWQPAEEHFRVTRALLTAMADAEGLDVRAHTRASLVARDADVLVRLAKRNRVSVSFSLASVDDRINRLMEPNAPSALRRLAALEALARAGVDVGVLVSPLLAGLDEKELGLEPLLARAANAGARFAGLGFLHFGPGQREAFLARITELSPGQALRVRRVIGRRGATDAERQEILDVFRGLCGRFGLMALAEPVAPPGAERLSEPAQMALFS
jgi:DNA repair photolyase